MPGPETAPSDFAELAARLAATCRWLYARGWAPATSGNFSARVDAATVAITASGLDKGEVTEDGILRVGLDGVPLPSEAARGLRPSAETLLHTTLYRRLPGVGAVLHVHAPAATTLSAMVGGGGAVRLQGWEMLKALDGVTSHAHVEIVPVVDNDQDIARLAARAEERLAVLPGAHAYLIAGHGLYTWGPTLAGARRHVEALETLFDYELRTIRAHGGSR